MALGLLAIGFGLAIAAEYLPWATFKLDVSADEEFLVPLRRTRVPIEIDLSGLSTGHVVSYLLTMVLALVAIAALVAGSGVVRRIATPRPSRCSPAICSCSWASRARWRTSASARTPA